MITIYLDLDENNYINGWGTAQEKQGNTFEITVPEDNELILTGGFRYFYVSSDGTKILKDSTAHLNIVKEGKLESLKISCQEDILNGFDYDMGIGVYHFYYSETDQQNMIQNKYALEMGEEVVPWRGYKDGQPFDFQIKETQFNTMFKEAVRVKNHKLKLLREYYPTLLSSLGSIEEVNNVKWDSSIEMG